CSDDTESYYFYSLSLHDALPISINVDGTSNIHDWDLKAEKFTVKAIIEDSADLPAIKSLNLDLEAESLKSGKSGVDKNTYKALKDRKSTRLNSSHVSISYAVFCL